MLSLAPAAVRSRAVRAPRPSPSVDRAHGRVPERQPSFQPVEVVAPTPTGLLRHTLLHTIFAEHGCAYCSRSYARAMARYEH